MVKMNWNQKWQFTKDSVAVSEGSSVLAKGSWEELDLPHTWNGEDGQDGGNDYYRGTCYYVKSLKASEFPEGDEIYIEFEGANSSADLYVNGQAAAHHDGGYSTWRANITGLLKEDNEIVVAVDNAPNDHVYPQMADFTFYGGLYRNVNLIGVKKARFDLDYYGGPGIAVTPKVEGADAKVRVDAYLTGISGTEKVTFSIWDGDQVIAETIVPASEASAEMEIVGVHLWNGRKDPHLYTMKAVLAESGAELDSREVRFGCRTYEIDPERGFIERLYLKRGRVSPPRRVAPPGPAEEGQCHKQSGSRGGYCPDYGAGRNHDPSCSLSARSVFLRSLRRERSGHLGGDSIHFPAYADGERKHDFPDEGADHAELQPSLHCGVGTVQ